MEDSGIVSDNRVCNDISYHSVSQVVGMITRHDLTHEHLHDVLHTKKIAAGGVGSNANRNNSNDGVLDLSSRIVRVFSFNAGSS